MMGKSDINEWVCQGKLSGDCNDPNPGCRHQDHGHCEEWDCSKTAFCSGVNYKVKCIHINDVMIEEEFLTDEEMTI
jgi:hypothetical protein